MFIGDAWYIAAWEDELSDGPIFRRILDQPVVLFRSVDGTAAALYDSCVHRGAPLSLGDVVDDGLQCGYHGLVFGTDGVCVHVPGQTKVQQKLRVRSYPTAEKDQIIWIWMGDPDKADPDQILSYPFHDDTANWPHRHAMAEVAAPYEMLMDNLMDLTHLGFVHATNVGGGAAALVEAEMDVNSTEWGVEVRRWMADVAPPPTYRACVDLPERVERWQEFDYVAPAAVVQWNGAVAVGNGAREDHSKREGGFGLRLFHFATPSTPTSCYYFWSGANGHNTDDPQATDDLEKELVVAIDEDKWIVEAQQTRVAQTGSDWLVDIRSDRARVAMRRSLERMLDSSGPVASGPTP